MNEKIINDIIEFLSKLNTKNIRFWKSDASISSVRSHLVEKGWINIPSGEDFIYELENAGFDVVPALLKNGKEHKSVRVVTI